MATFNQRTFLPACALALWLASPSAPADTGNFYLGPAYTVDGHKVDPFDSSQVRWMKSQALWLRRQEYADMAANAGTADYYRKEQMINAQIQLDYAKIDLEVVHDTTLATQELDEAQADLKQAQQGATKDQLTQIKQVNDSINRIKTGIADLKPAPDATHAVAQDIAHAADALKTIVVAKT